MLLPHARAQCRMRKIDASRIRDTIQTGQIVRQDQSCWCAFKNGLYVIVRWHDRAIVTAYKLYTTKEKRKMEKERKR